MQKIDGIPGGPPELGALENVNKILKTDKFVMAEPQMLTEAGVQRLDKGPQVQDQQTDDGGGPP